MVGGLQDETRRAVAFMDEGVQSVDNRLTLTETASAENAQLHAAVQRIFEIIRQLNERSLQYGQTIRGVEHASADMGATLAVLGGSAERVRHTARKLQQLVGQFRVSGQVR
jgi:methyl-accepting chemotaxis protein